jgi:hypothetical protein
MDQLLSGGQRLPEANRKLDMLAFWVRANLAALNSRASAIKPIEIPSFLSLIWRFHRSSLAIRYACAGRTKFERYPSHPVHSTEFRPGCSVNPNIVYVFVSKRSV